MWYLIGFVGMVLAGFFVYANIKKSRIVKYEPAQDNKSQFRSEEDLKTYGKPMDDKHSHVDFDDAE